ncbi:MAG: polar amino acid transport system substrate-binding protein [Glaciecola sp.]
MLLRALCLFLFPFCLYANEQSLVIYTEEFPPYNFSQDGKITGINIKLVQAACEEVGIECEFQILPWNRAMRMARNGPNTGLVSTARIPEREKWFSWVGPFIMSQNCIFKLASRTDIHIPNLESAKNYVLGGGADATTAYKETLDELGFVEGKNLKRYKGKGSNMRPFAAGRVDLIIDSATGIKVRLAIANLTLDDVVPVAAIDTSYLLGNHLALHPSVDDSLVKKLQASIERLKLSGEAAKIELEFVQPIAKSSPNNVETSLWNKCMRENVIN